MKILKMNYKIKYILKILKQNCNYKKKLKILMNTKIIQIRDQIVKMKIFIQRKKKMINKIIYKVLFQKQWITKKIYKTIRMIQY